VSTTETTTPAFTASGSMTGATAKRVAHELCLHDFTAHGVVGAAAAHGITLSPAQQQRATSEVTERELIVGIGQRVADPFGYNFDDAREGCDEAYAEWVQKGRPGAASEAGAG